MPGLFGQTASSLARSVPGSLGGWAHLHKVVWEARIVYTLRPVLPLASYGFLSVLPVDISVGRGIDAEKFLFLKNAVCVSSSSSSTVHRLWDLLNFAYYVGTKTHIVHTHSCWS